MSEEKLDRPPKSYWLDWRTLVAMVFITAGLVLFIRPHVYRLIRSDPKEEKSPEAQSFTIPSYEEAVLHPESMVPACEAVELPVPPLDKVDKEIAVAIYSATRNALIHYQDAEATGQLGMVYHAHDYAAQARRAYTRAQELAPSDYRWAYYHAYTSFELGDSETAIKGFLRTLELNQDYYPCHLNLGKLYHDVGEYEKADEAHRAYLKARPDDPLGYVGLGLTAQAREDYQAVIRHMSEAIQHEPVDYRALYALGLAHREVGDVEKARHYLEQAENTPKTMAIHDPLWSEKNALSVTLAASQQQFVKLMTAGRLDEALKLAREMAARAPNDYGVAINQAEVCRQSRLSDEAETAARRAVRLQPESAHGHAVLASVLRDAGQLDLALEHVDHALKLDPQFSPGWDVRASICLNQNHVDETLRSIRMAIELNPDRAQTWKQQLQIHAMRLDAAGDREGVLTTLKIYLELYPDEAAVQQKYEELRASAVTATKPAQ